MTVEYDFREKCLACDGNGWVLHPFDGEYVPGLGKHIKDCSWCNGSRKTPYPKSDIELEKIPSRHQSNSLTDKGVSN